MRIAHVLPYGLSSCSGVLASVVGISTALSRHGHATELWQLGEDRGLIAPEQLAALRAEGVEHILVPVRAGGWLLGSAGKRAIARRSPCLVHLHGVFSPPNDLLARSLAGPYVFSPHGGYAPAARARHRLRKLCYERVYEWPKLRGASAVFALNEVEAEDVRRVGYAGPIAVVPNGVGPTPEAVDAQHFRQEIAVADHERLALFVGRLDVYYKRLDTLVRAFRGAREWRLALVGPDWRGSARALGRLIRNEGLAGKVCLVGPRRGRDLQEALAAADLFVMLSRSEGLPMALLEALNHGTPALLSPPVERAVGVAACGAGWVVEPEGLASALDALSQIDAAEWSRCRRAARHAARGFAWDRVVKRYEAGLARAGILPRSS